VTELAPGRSLVIWGCGGHGRVVLDAARAGARFDRIAFCDDDETAEGRDICGAEVLRGGIEAAAARGFSRFVVAVGRNDLRRRCWERALRSGLRAETCLHPTAWVSSFAAVGTGSVVLAGAIVQTGAVVGDDVIVNTAAVIEHDVRIEDHAHVSPGAVLGGGVAVGSGSHVGAGAVILPGVRVGNGSIVGAGAVVREDVPGGVTVVGVPARIPRTRS